MAEYSQGQDGRGDASMKALRVNLVRGPSYGRMLFGLGVVGLALAAAYRLPIGVRSAERAQDLQSRLALAKGRAATAVQATPEPAASVAPAYAADAARVVQLASFPTGEILDHIETVRIPGVRLTRIEISAHSAQVLLEIEAPDLQALLQYVGKLHANDSRFSWRLVRSEVGTSGGVVATVQAAPMPGSLDDSADRVRN